MASTTTPGDWFLPEILSTEGNKATPLIDGQSYFADLTARLSGDSGPMSVYVVGWRADPDTPLDISSGSTARGVLEGLLSQPGATLRALLWYVPGSVGALGAGHGVENVSFAQFVTQSGGEAVLDDRLPQGRFASHHQKYVLISDDSGQTAFLGGIDLAPDRWDSSRHDNSPDRHPEHFAAWHDVQVRVDGPAVHAIWQSFRKRWNDQRRPHGYPAIGGQAPTPLPPSAPVMGAPLGTHAVQIVETYACESRAGDGTVGPYPFAPEGDYSYERLLRAAIANAEHFIYIEDQYFWPCRVVDALAAAAERGVVVTLVLTRSLEVVGMEPYHNYLRHEAVAQLQEGADNNVFVFHLEQPSGSGAEQIYVHSKSMVIDDRFLIIGSANVNRRSMQTDSEIGVAVVDTAAVDSTIGGRSQSVGRLPRDYRKALWTEHLGVPATNDPIDSAGRPAGFPVGDELVGHTRRHIVPEPRFCEPSVIPFGLMNARTTCS